MMTTRSSTRLVLFSSRVLQQAGRRRVPFTTSPAILFHRENINSRPKVQTLLSWRDLVACSRRNFASSASSSQNDNHDDDDPKNSSNNRLNSFDILGIEKTFTIDLQELKNKYRQLMSKVHPDKHTLKSQEEQDKVQQQASQVTQSYEILKETTTRATHLLQILGKLDYNTTSMDDSLANARLLEDHDARLLLMQIMDINETIENTVESKELKQLLNENHERRKETIQQLEQAFQNNELNDALKLTIKLQYWKRIEQNIRDKMD